MGVISGTVPRFTLTVLPDKVKFLRHVDDPMSMLHTHAVAGTLGGILTGLLAVPKLCRIFYMVTDWDKYIGLLYGLQSGNTIKGLKQLGVQIAAMIFVVCLNVVVTSLICWVIGLFMPLRLPESLLEVGDGEVHGEEAFDMVGEDGRREKVLEGYPKQYYYTGFEVDVLPSLSLKSYKSVDV